jgi:hypothetical protein
MEQIASLVEQEVERRVQERLNDSYSKISQTYDISIKHLIRETTSVWNGNVCHGLTKKNQKCPRGAPDGTGYCKSHKDQKPIPRIVKPPSPQITQQHTHSLPPMFLDGCPVCEASKNLRIDI